MSQTGSSTNLIVEWSPRKITVYDPATRSLQSYADPIGIPFAGRTAILAISRKSLFVRATRVPNAAPEDIRQVVMLKLAELFPVPPTDLAFDYGLLSDVNQEGRLALIVAMQVTELRRARDQMNAAGIKVSRVIPISLGSMILAESLGYQDAAIVEKSEDAASIDVIVDGVLRYSRVASIASPLEVEINRTFNAAGLPCTAVIAAGGAQVGEADLTTGGSAIEALAGNWTDRLKLNLQLPETIAAREMKQRRERLAFSVFVFLIGASALFYTWSDRANQAKNIDWKSKDLSSKLSAIKKQAGDASKKAGTQLAIEQSLLASFAPAQKMGDIVIQAVNLLPDGVWLTGISVQRGKEMTLRGTATSADAVTNYVAAMNGNSRFRNARLVFQNQSSIEKTPVVEFSVSAFPQGNLPTALTQAAPKAKGATS